MNKKLITLLVLLVAISAKSQFYFQLNSGYAKGINNKTYFNKENSYTNKPYYNLDTSNYSQYNLAQGFFIEPQVGYKINNWLEFSLGFYYNNNYLFNGYANSFDYEEPRTYIMLNEYGTDSIGTRVTIKQNRYKTKYSSRVYGITPQINLKKTIKNFEIALNIGLFISDITIYLKTDSTNFNNGKGFVIYDSVPPAPTIIDDAFTKTTKKINDYELSSNINISARLGLSFSYYFYENLCISFNTFYNNIEFIPNKRIRTNYYYKKYNGYPNSTDIQTDEEITEYIDGDLFGMNTLQFSLGIRYTFDKTKQNE